MKRKFLITLLAIVASLTYTLALSACGGGNAETHEPPTVAVSSVSLDKSELTLEIGGEETLTATVNPDNATDKTVTWFVSPAGIVTVANGKVTAVAAGTATVTATAGSKSDACSVTVNAAVTGEEVTAGQWTQIMESATQFSIDISIDGTPDTTINIDGDKISQESGQDKQIFVKDGENYYQYTLQGSDWVKSDLDANTYETSEIYAQFVNLFKDDYGAFTYSDGVYTTVSLDKTNTLGVTVSNVTVVFVSGALSRIEFEAETGSSTYKYEIKKVGGTTIEIPDKKPEQSGEEQATEGLEYTLNSDGNSYSVKKGTATATEIVIPSEHNGKPVTRIGRQAFYGCAEITSVKIPDSVTYIGIQAFSNCSSLASITIPDSVTYIGENALNNTAWYNGQPDGLVYAGKVAYKFKGATGNISVTLQDGTKGIAGGAFSNCDRITGITIPDSVTRIASGAFMNCSFTSITIPDGVTAIEEAVFSGCTNLTSITISGNVTSIGNDAFFRCLSLSGITFNGTKDQWTGITKGETWNENTGNYTIYCTNGNISKN